MSSTQKALVQLEKQGPLVVQDADIPMPGPGELLVEVRATGLNPVDWKIQTGVRDFGLKYPVVLGNGSAGIVKAIGEGVDVFSVGDAVFHQGDVDPRNGTFQQYVIAPSEIVGKLPSNISFDQAAALPLAFTTAACALYGNPTSKGPGGAGLTAPWDQGRGKYAGQPILIVGGASSVGQYTIQLAKLSGFSPIITTASARNESLLKDLGATHVLDRATLNLNELSNTLKSITSEPIMLAFDTVTSPDGQNAAYDAVAPGGKFVHFLPLHIDESKRTGEKQLFTVYGSVYPPFQRAFGVKMWKHLPAMLAAGEIKPSRVEVIADGLAGIPAGLDRLRQGVSAVKLVAHPQETP